MSNLFRSMHDMMNFSSKDWALEKEDAWLYGIVVGWDADDPDDPDDSSCMLELQRHHGWSDEAIVKLRRFRQEWLAIQKKESQK